MGWVSTLLACIGVYLMYRTGHMVLMVCSIIAALGGLGSWALMHNYATQLAKRRSNYTGRFYDITDQEADAIPDWTVWISVAFGLLSLALVIAGIVLAFGKPGETLAWLNWLVLLIGLFFLFLAWGWVPLERLDRYWSKNNEIGRPFINTVILTGLPVLYARLMGTPASWLLIPICFLLTQYAVLAGRFREREMFIAGWVMIVTTVAIWTVYFAL